MRLLKIENYEALLLTVDLRACLDLFEDMVVRIVIILARHGLRLHQGFFFATLMILDLIRWTVIVFRLSCFREAIVFEGTKVRFRPWAGEM